MSIEHISAFVAESGRLPQCLCIVMEPRLLLDTLPINESLGRRTHAVFPALQCSALGRTRDPQFVHKAVSLLNVRYWGQSLMSAEARASRVLATVAVNVMARLQDKGLVVVTNRRLHDEE